MTTRPRDGRKSPGAEPPTQAYELGDAPAAVTKGYDVGAEATAAYDDSVDGNARLSFRAPRLLPGHVIELLGVAYTVERIISEGTGEAIVYLVRDPRQREPGRRLLSLKLYDARADARAEPNRTALKRIATIKDPDVLRLFAFGSGPERYLNRHCFELSQYAEGGNLLTTPDGELLDEASLVRKYSASFLRKEVIPQIVKGLRCLHGAGIYHCDLKPENIFWLDRAQTDLVIGDYGSAKTREGDAGERLTYTSLILGTQRYIAPEQYEGAFSDKNDTYSLGMILVRLLRPEALSSIGFARLRADRDAGLPVVGVETPQLRELGQLINGLTLRHWEARWGLREVEQFLAGEHVEVRYPGAPKLEPIVVGKARIETVDALVEYVFSSEKWFDHLIVEEDARETLEFWAGQLHGLSGKKSLRAALTVCQKLGSKKEAMGRLARHAVVTYFRPKEPIRLLSSVYDLWGAKDPIREVARLVDEVDKEWSTRRSSNLQATELLVQALCALELSFRPIASLPSDEQPLLASGQSAHGICVKLDEIFVTRQGDTNGFQLTWCTSVDIAKWLRVAWALNPQRGWRTGGRSLTTPNEVNDELWGRPSAREETLELAEIHAFLSERCGVPRQSVGQVTRQLDLHQRLWTAGATGILIGRRLVRSLGDFRSVLEQRDAAIALMERYDQGLLMPWLELVCKLPQNRAAALRNAMGDISGPTSERQLVGWLTMRAVLFPDLPLPVGKSTVGSPNELPSFLARHIDLTNEITELVQNRGVDVWLRHAHPQEGKAALDAVREFRSRPGLDPSLARSAISWALDPNARFYFSTHAVAAPRELAAILEASPRLRAQAASTLLGKEDFRLWLVARGEARLAEQVTELARSHERDAIRIESLIRLLDPRLEEPRLEVAPRVVGPLDLLAGESTEVTIRISNATRGYLHGTIENASSGASALSLSALTFEALPGASTNIGVRIDTSGLRTGETHHERLAIRAAAGVTYVEIQFRVRVPWQAAIRSALLFGATFGAVLFFLREALSATTGGELLLWSIKSRIQYYAGPREPYWIGFFLLFAGICAVSIWWLKAKRR